MNANIGNTPVFEELLLIMNEIQKKPVFPDSPEDKLLGQVSKYINDEKDDVHKYLRKKVDSVAG